MKTNTPTLFLLLSLLATPMLANNPNEDADNELSRTRLNEALEDNAVINPLDIEHERLILENDQLRRLINELNNIEIVNKPNSEEQKD